MTAAGAHVPTQQQKLDCLRAVANHKDTPRRITVIETHFAWIFLSRRFAWKLRKPLRHASMDYRTLHQRRRGCAAEVTLNQRLAPGVYLDVVPLTMAHSGRLRLGGSGRPVDYLVKMRRLAAASMLDVVLQRRSLRGGEVAALLDALGRFFRTARQRPLPDGDYLTQLRRGRSACRRSLLACTPGLTALIERVDLLQRAAHKALRQELAARGAHLVDGHGDLRPEHVCLRPRIAVIDCIEFEPELRRLDPLEELAFLALEMGRQGHAAMAWAMLRQYRDIHAPAASDALLHFYMSHRALVRATLSAWHIGDPQFPDPRPWRRRTRSYLRDAARHARRAGIGLRVNREAASPPAAA
jgi:aminoglycoside phosphotransferase family enzyme